MVSVKKIMAAIIAALSAALGIVMAVLSGKSRELKAEKAENEKLKDTTGTQSAVIQASAEARGKTNERIESTNSGDSGSDFDVSIGVLHDIANRKRK